MPPLRANGRLSPACTPLSLRYRPYLDSAGCFEIASATGRKGASQGLKGASAKGRSTQGLSLGLVVLRVLLGRHPAPVLLEPAGDLILPGARLAPDGDGPDLVHLQRGLAIRSGVANLQPGRKSPNDVSWDTVAQLQMLEGVNWDFYDRWRQQNQRSNNSSIRPGHSYQLSKPKALSFCKFALLM